MQRLSASIFWTYDCLELIRIWKKKWNHWDSTYEKNNIWTSSAAGCGHCFSFFFWFTLSSPWMRWMRSELLLVGLVKARICLVLWFRPGCITSSSYKWCADNASLSALISHYPGMLSPSIKSLERRPPLGTRVRLIIDAFTECLFSVCVLVKSNVTYKSVVFIMLLFMLCLHSQNGAL